MTDSHEIVDGLPEEGEIDGVFETRMEKANILMV
jgi:hypothetical protein